MAKSKTRKVTKKPAERRISLDNIGIAVNRTAKLSPAIIEELKRLLLLSVTRLGVVGDSARAWNDIRLACILARRIERKGVVPGLSTIISDATDALDDIYRRNMATGVWRMNQIRDADRTRLNELAKVHIFQLSQLGKSEFEGAFLQSNAEAMAMPRAVESETAKIRPISPEFHEPARLAA
jgi:hypothetical protein